ncbi:hypothetical protein [Dickeya chrysanthemi]|uniref:VWFA domain-containing protein n=1 Tax=Dickeya chrysanthemi TaxID=556 RepID=A0ABU8JM25_DICCH|nr:hypothetical protein [Dickeya chrysanthemi]MBX9445505.1 hypothetical protein [Dickeya chrysanthemi]MCA7009094.1 hypothetical protein [Dickeya chrysanthemi]
MKTLFLLFFLSIAFTVSAGERNDISSCYSAVKLESSRPDYSGRELVIIIDQTVKVPLDLKKSLWQQVIRYVQAGDHIVLYQFSALLQDNYMKRIFDGKLEVPLNDKNIRNHIGMESLKSLDRCLVQQKQFFEKAIGNKMAESFAEKGNNIAKSEILDSLKRISEDLRSESATTRVILLISDMLENSEFSSFYSNNSIRLLDPEKEMVRVKKQQLIADFSGASIYISGAGLIDTDSPGVYRSGKIIQKLEGFWRQYFDVSQAKLVSFGVPELTVNLK